MIVKVKDYDEFIAWCKPLGLLTSNNKLRSVNQYDTKEVKVVLLEAKDMLVSMTSWLPGNLKIQYRSNAMKYGLNKDNWECPACGDPRKMSSSGNKFEVTCGKKDEAHSEAQKKSQIAKVKETRRTSGKDYSRTKAAQLKFENTCLTKFGSKSPLGSKEIRAKSDATNLEKRGVKNVMQDPSVVKKGRETVFAKHGVYNVLQVPSILAKRTQTNKRLFGGPSPMCDPRVVAKFIRNFNINYGVDNPRQLHLNQENIEKLNKEFVEENYLTKEGYIKLDEIMLSLNCSVFLAYGLFPRFDIEYKCRVGTSRPEEEIIEFLRELDPNMEIISRDRKKIAPKELDIYLPKYNLAIEYNGLIFHSQGISNYAVFNTPHLRAGKHLRKTEACEEQGIQLFHIFENEWLNPTRKEIWKSMIKNRLGMTEKRLDMRNSKVSVRELITREEKSLADTLIQENHMQGLGAPASVYFGLFEEDNLISCMTFRKSSRTSPLYKDAIELDRLVTVKDTYVNGGPGKLLKSYVDKYNPTKVVSFANRRWSTGGLYNELKFNFNHTSQPNFFWFKPENVAKGYSLESRLTYQKHTMTKHFSDEVDTSLSARAIMFNNGFRRIYDSGNHVFVKNY